MKNHGALKKNDPLIPVFTCSLGILFKWLHKCQVNNIAELSFTFPYVVTQLI